MKPGKFVPVAGLMFCMWLVAPLGADIVVHNSNSEPVAEASVVEPVAAAGAETGPPRFFAIPEPATFGLISLGLAIGGGLLVRNKRHQGQ